MKVLIAFACLLVVAAAFPQIPKVAFTNGRIYGGRNADDGEFPFQVSVQYTYIINFEHICGGSIISANKVLSAAHCQTEVPGSGRYTLWGGVTSFDRTALPIHA